MTPGMVYRQLDSAERRLILQGDTWSIGFWREPPRRIPKGVVIHCPGWSGIADSPRYLRWHEALLAAGFAVFAFDFPGRGRSDDAPPVTTIELQQEALLAAISTVRYESGFDAAVGLFGSGATGGSLVLDAAASVPEVAAVVSQFPIARGSDWIGHLLSASQRGSLEGIIEQDRSRRVMGNPGAFIDFAAGRAGRAFQISNDARAGWIPIELVESVLQYDPLARAGGVHAPVLFLAVSDDQITPESQARSLASALGGAHRFVLQRDVSHYEVYTAKADAIEREMVSWFTQYLSPGAG